MSRPRGRRTWGAPTGPGRRPRPPSRSGGRDAGARAGAGEPERPGPGAGPRGRSHGLGGDQVEGRRAVLELLRAGTRPVRELWVAEGLEPSPQLDEIERLAVRRKVKTLLVPRRRFDTQARTEAPQGVLARARALEEADLDGLVNDGDRVPLLLVLDGVTDPHNFGSLLRSADAAGATGVVVARHRAAHVTPTVTKVAAGAIEHVPIAVVPGIPAALRRLTDAGVAVMGLDADASRSIYDLGPELSEPLAVVLGAEGRGLARLSRARCDTLVALPRQGRLDSLNVAVAGAVALFEVARRRR